MNVRHRAFVLTLGIALIPGIAAAQATYYDDAARVPGGYGFAGDGTAYLLADVGDDTRLTRVTPQGAAMWRTTFDGNTVHAAEIRANGNRVCTVAVQGEAFAFPDVSVAVCVAADTGALLYRTVIDEDATSSRPLIDLRDDGTLVVLYYDENQLRRVVVDADGTVQASAVIDGTTGTREDDGYFADDGSTVAYHNGSDQLSFVRIAADGSVSARIFDGISLRDAQITPDGRILTLTGSLMDSQIVSLYAADGTQLWRRTLRDMQYFVYPLVFDDDTVYFATSATFDDGSIVHLVPPYSYVALDLDTGTPRWDVDVPASRDGYFTGDIADAPHAQLVNVMSFPTNKVRVQVRDRATGAIARDTEVDCGREHCRTSLVHVDDNGTVRIIGYDEPDEAGFAMVLTNLAAASNQFSRPTQRGIRGAYTVNTDGQGLFFDYDAASRTIFGAWFTTSYRPRPLDTDTVADLHWYTVQAQYDRDDARELPMTIYETAGGRFAEGPVVTPQAVGTASLSFFACGTGAMTYDFDEGHNDGAAGIVALRRLTPLTDNCDQFGGTDGIIIGPQVPATDAAGFHRDFSGTWSQLGAAGQGALIVVHPGSDIAGAWFTYDPAGADNDAQRHHWFTLQGSIVGASSRTATLTLYESVGGSLDYNPAHQITAVGTATLVFVDCDRATLAYAFGANAGAFAMRQGTVTFEHLGGCPAP